MKEKGKKRSISMKLLITVLLIGVLLGVIATYTLIEPFARFLKADELEKCKLENDALYKSLTKCYEKLKP